MKTIRTGHRYDLANFEHPEKEGQTIQFIEQVVDKDAPIGLRTVYDGTTSEEVLAMLIDRHSIMNQVVPSRESAMVITKMEEALMWLNKRTADRKARQVYGTNKP